MTAAKRARVDETRVAPLNVLARSLRSGPDGKDRFVPWFDPDSAGVHARVPPVTHDLDGAREALARLLDLLPRLELIVAVGGPALSGVMRHLTLDPLDPLAIRRTPRVLDVPHPSPRNAQQRRQSLDRLRNALSQPL